MHLDGEVGYSYHDIICDLADNLGGIVSDPGEIHLYDHDTGDIEAWLKLMEPHLSNEVIETVKQIVPCQ